MEQDLKEKVQKQAAEWDAAKELPAMKILPDRAEDQANVVNPVKAGDRENLLKGVRKNRILTNI